MPTARLGKTTKLGRVDLQVTDIQRSIDFYTNVIGLAIVSESPITILGVPSGSDHPKATQLVALHENPDAPPHGRTAGIYHFALLYQSRQELAFAAARIVRTSTPIQGATDHGTHEAIYLPDPDGIGIELAWDRPSSQWPTPKDRLSAPIGMQPLDVESLLSLVPSAEEAPETAGPGLTMGHLHLHVSSLEAGRSFYELGLGFEEQMAIPTAAFASASGYHHHVAFNTWKGEGAPPMDSNATGLRHWSLNVDAEDFALIVERLSSGGYGLTRYAPDDQTVVATDSDGIPVWIQVSQ